MKLYQGKTIKVKEITLLSINDIKIITNMEASGRIPDFTDVLKCRGGNDYWLSTSGYCASTRNNYVMTVDPHTGEVNEAGFMVRAAFDIRPVLVCSNLMTKHKIGDKIHFADSNLTYTIISETKALADFSLGQMPFRREFHAEDANDFEKSDIKRWLDNWAKRERLIVPESEQSLER